MITVKIYPKEGCHLCEEARRTFLAVQKDFLFKLEEVDITSDKVIYEEFKEKIPVIFIDQGFCLGPKTIHDIVINNSLFYGHIFPD
ncbi:MAG: hypothetical protein A3G93_02650 [Nitrospinae bacterium RIFCSPLOWO2_12_FULL_45_22]|nr:MAG: hypothetical protein A3G93_02650 [Nitrospinae bacterium RIFCSPLOWO2_12_FULL_45_22]